MKAPGEHFRDYAARLRQAAEAADPAAIERLAQELLDCWKTGRQVFVCGNGGSGANAEHIANDFLYPVSKIAGSGLRIHALPANSAAVTCIANDEGYDAIFSMQLGVLARPGDVLIVLSGSGNSPNIVKALEEGRRLKLRSYAIVGFGGGKAKSLADVAIHFAVDDMQIAEDLQMATAHVVMQWLYAQRETVRPAAHHG